MSKCGNFVVASRCAIIHYLCLFISPSIETNDPIRCYNISGGVKLKSELTAIIEKAQEGGYWAIGSEVPGANGQGETVEETIDL